jgi:hypothetical protein
MLPESPFRFIVVDDPVQSMDSPRVEGLARVLEEAGQHRQVIVFTHDERLPEAVRRLRLDARILEVTRRPGSVVEVVEALDPVSRSLKDARAVAMTERLPLEVARRVVPGLCRQAIEAACLDVVRHKRLGRGDPHAAVEEALESATTTKQRLALALFDDAGRAGDVLRHLNLAWGRWAGDCVNAVNRGAHGQYEGDLPHLIRETERLTGELRTL